MRSFICNILLLSMFMSSNVVANPSSDKKQTTGNRITLDEAMQRIRQARERLAQDRLTLEQARSKISQQTYNQWIVKLNAQGRSIDEKEQMIKERMHQAAQEIRVRETTGARFFEEQAKYYRHIGSDDIDTRLD
jgi:hypothetical protein